MNILDLLHSKGINTGRRVAATNGGEYHSACPRCGGKDRFHSWPAQGDKGGTWWCRNCGKSGDLIEFFIYFDGLTYGEACRLGLEARQDFRKLPDAPKKEGAEVFSGCQRELPPPLWREKAAKLVEVANQALLNHEPLRGWLMKRRGIFFEQIHQFKLGYLAGENGKPCYWRPRSAWGLENVEYQKGENKRVKTKIWIPRGLLIPTFQDNELVSLRVRLSEADRREKGSSPYYVLPGGAALPMMAVSARLQESPKAWVVVESQLDALMIAELCAAYQPALPVGAMAMLSCSGKPCPRSHAALKEAGRILVALDYDQAGAKAARWWAKAYAQTQRWPTPFGKDPGDYYAQGGDIYSWIKEGLELEGK